MKQCNVCQEVKPLSQFHKSKTNRLGVNPACKPCRSSIQAGKYRANWFHKVAVLKKSWCKKNGIPFDLDGQYLESLWTPTCPAFGTEFVMHDKKNDFSPALDRLVPELGYVKGNVVWLSARANRIKYDASVEELKMVLAYVEGATTIPEGSTLK